MKRPETNCFFRLSCATAHRRGVDCTYLIDPGGTTQQPVPDVHPSPPATTTFSICRRTTCEGESCVFWTPNLRYPLQQSLTAIDTAKRSPLHTSIASACSAGRERDDDYVLGPADPPPRFPYSWPESRPPSRGSRGRALDNSRTLTAAAVRATSTDGSTLPGHLGVQHARRPGGWTVQFPLGRSPGHPSHRGPPPRCRLRTDPVPSRRASVFITHMTSVPGAGANNRGEYALSSASR